MIYQLSKTMLQGAPLLIKANTARSHRPSVIRHFCRRRFQPSSQRILVMGVIWVMLTRLIVAPLNKLTNHVVDVGRTGDLTKRVALERNDEIGVLAKDSMPQPSNWDRSVDGWSMNSTRVAWPKSRRGSFTCTKCPLPGRGDGLASVRGGRDAAGDSLRCCVQGPEIRTTNPERRAMLVEYVEAAMKAMLERGQRFAEDLRIVAEQNRHIEQILQDHSALSIDKRRFEPVKLSGVIMEATPAACQRCRPSSRGGLRPMSKACLRSTATPS